MINLMAQELGSGYERQEKSAVFPKYLLLRLELTICVLFT